MRLECPVKVGEVFKPAPGSDRQHCLVRSIQRFGGGIQPVFVQKGNKALPCHLPEPAHEVAGTEGADPGGIGDPKPLGIMDRDPLQNGFQPLGIGSFRGELLFPLRNEKGEKAQQCSFDQQLIAGKLGTVGFLHLPQAGGGLEITQVVGSQPRRQQQPPALERKQVFFGAKVLRTAQKLIMDPPLFSDTHLTEKQV